MIFAFIDTVVLGAASIFGGLASRRAPLMVAVAYGETFSLLYVVPLVLLEGSSFRWSDFALGLVVGVASIVTVTATFLAVRMAHVGTVNAIAGGVGAVIPAVWHGVVGGSLNAWIAMGVLLAVVAVVLISRPPANRDPDHDGIPVTSPRAVLLSLIGGVGFGAVLILFSYTSGKNYFSLTLGARLMITVVLFVPLTVMRKIPRFDRVTFGILIAPVVLYTLSDLLFIMATHSANPTAVATVLAMNPALTALFGFMFLNERLGRPQMAGLALALGAIVTVSLA